MKRHWAVLGLAISTVLAACGGGSSTTASGSTIKIAMKDIAFDPTTVQVRRGDTVSFEFKNTGAVVHEAFIGDQAAQDSHAMEMSAGGMSSTDSMGEHGGGHGAEGSEMVTVDPGKTGTLSYTFATAGTFIIGCHQPGHYEAGMKVTVTVQ